MSKQIRDFPAANVGASTDKYLIQTLAGVTSYILKSVADAIITISDKLILANGAEIRVDGDNIGWEDLIGHLVARGSGVNDPSFTAYQGSMYAYEFSASVMQQLWINYHIRHDWHPGSIMSVHIHFLTSSTTATGTVRFGLEYHYAKGHDQEAFPVTNTVYVEYTFTTNKQYRTIIIEFPDISDPNFEVDGILNTRCFRDAAHVNDTFVSTIHMLSVDIHYQKSRFATKNKAPNFYV